MEQSQDASQQFKPSKTFFGYSLKFLKRPITVKLENPVTLKTCKFGYLLKDVSDEDISALDKVFDDMNVTVVLDPDSFFIKRINKWAIFNSKGQRIKNLSDDETLAKVDIKVMGYKVSTTGGKASPMLEITKVAECSLDFADD